MDALAQGALAASSAWVGGAWRAWSMAGGGSSSDTRRLRSPLPAGMLYLHSRTPAVYHRDLKSANLLVTASWQVKVRAGWCRGQLGADREQGWVSSLAQQACCLTAHFPLPDPLPPTGRRLQPVALAPRNPRPEHGGSAEPAVAGARAPGGRRRRPALRRLGLWHGGRASWLGLLYRPCWRGGCTLPALPAPRARCRDSPAQRVALSLPASLPRRCCGSC